MRIQTLAGYDDQDTDDVFTTDDIGKISLKKPLSKVTSAAKKGIKAVGDVAKKAVDLGKKTIFLAQRNAFLGLLRVNAGNLAYNMDRAYKRKPKDVSKIWYGVGGSMDSLRSAINAGKNKKPVLGIGEPVAAATFAGAVTTATPIIVAMKKLFKDLPPDQQKKLTEDFSKKALNNYGQEVLKKGAEKVALENVPGKVADKAKQKANAALKKLKEKKAGKKTSGGGGVTVPETQETGAQDTGSGNNTMLLLGLGAAALLVASSNK